MNKEELKEKLLELENMINSQHPVDEVKTVFIDIQKILSKNPELVSPEVMAPEDIGSLSRTAIYLLDMRLAGETKKPKVAKPRTSKRGTKVKLTEELLDEYL